ncbi:hypothetical protein Pyn_22951 [Prunus yedoensis var. nudiflora]|uniref:Uncharacterized protein n=1 Tax=Prunus yedoensis var. nudiflora TaxID=2094558 RepID=A0A314USF6_PRUYE|nr:hypothetical protein Pyn_22951 [Prunus yedoensis var. nudiflora]
MLARRPTRLQTTTLCSPLIDPRRRGPRAHSSPEIRGPVPARGLRFEDRAQPRRPDLLLPRTTS